MSDKPSIIDSRHPSYDLYKYDKHRTVMQGGRAFIDKYLKRHTRESDDEYARRRAITYNPAYATAAVHKIVRSSYQRLHAVSREGGSDSYQLACKGEQGGIDNLGNSIYSFIGRSITPEMLFLGKVGVIVDNAPYVGPTLADRSGHPYIYMYRAEDILNWHFDVTQPKRCLSLLLRDTILDLDMESGLPSTTKYRYRHYRLVGDQVVLQIYDDEGNPAGYTMMNIPAIPFVCAEIPTSLLEDIADHQIAALNLMSSDIHYAWGANFPFYTEQQDPFQDFRAPSSLPLQAPNAFESGDPLGHLPMPGAPPLPQAVRANTSDEVQVGPLTGRKYSKGLERPGFIHPSSEPLMASMKKEEQIKADINATLHLTMSAMSDPTSLDSGEKDGLEACLSYIGLELEAWEKALSDYWHMFEGEKNTAIIHYPEQYNIKSDEERRTEAKSMLTLQTATPSRTFQKNISKDIVATLYGARLEQQELDEMYDEIDNSNAPTADPTILQLDHEAGFVSTDTASMARGYAKGEADKAAIDHAERLARIQMAQTPTDDSGYSNLNAAARGVPDASGSPQNDASIEKDGTNKRGASVAIPHTPKSHANRRPNRPDLAKNNGGKH